MRSQLRRLTQAGVSLALFSLMILVIVAIPAVLAGCGSETTTTSSTQIATTTSSVVSTESTAPPTTTSSTTSSTTSTTQPAGAHTPQQGSAERRAIMNALRVATQHPDWVFVVVWLKVDGNWAYAHVRPQSADGTQNFEDLHALLRRSGTAWEVLKLTGGDEVPEGESPANLLKDLYPESPSDIYP